MAKDKPEPPSDEVLQKQDPEHTEDDFLADLDRATKRLADHEGGPAAPDPGSPRR